MPDQQSLLRRREWGFLSAEVKGMYGLRPREDYREKEEMRGYTQDLTLRGSQRTWDLEQDSLRTQTLCSSPPNTVSAYLLLQLPEPSAVPQTSHVFWHFCAFTHPALSASIVFHLLLCHSSRFVINEPLFKPLYKLLKSSSLQVTLIAVITVGFML